MKHVDQLPTDTSEDPKPGVDDGHRGNHGWMMMLCCVPMVVIAVALVVTGVASAGFLFTAVLCVGMMAVMMRGMNHSGSGKYR